MPNRTYIVFFIVIFFSAQSLKAQSETYTVEHYGIKNGLSQNYVNCVFQDAFGYIWVGTQDGLNKFDGYSFKVYKQDPNNKHSISHNFITGITASKDSSLWIVTNDGLEKYDHRSNLFQNILKKQAC
jgi:ligand-binding sensor domain-containing protein